MPTRLMSRLNDWRWSSLVVLMSTKTPVKSHIKILQVPRTVLSPRSAQGRTDISARILHAASILGHKKWAVFFAEGWESFVATRFIGAKRHARRSGFKQP